MLRSAPHLTRIDAARGEPNAVAEDRGRRHRHAAPSASRRPSCWPWPATATSAAAASSRPATSRAGISTSIRERFRPDESVDELNDRFRARRPRARRGARPRAALDRAGWAPSDVDFLATTTCTGRLTPSLDAHLVARLGCRRDVQRVHVGDTGCAAAVVALQQACEPHARVPRSPGARARRRDLLGRLLPRRSAGERGGARHLRRRRRRARAVARDGAGPAIVAHRTLFRSEHLDAMGFEYPGGRPRVVLSKDVRRIGATMMAEMATHADGRARGSSVTDVRHWVLHSAGRRVLDRARALLELDEAALAPRARGAARLRQHVLRDDPLRARAARCGGARPMPGEWGVMIGLGPGFAAEGALLRW